MRVSDEEIQMVINDMDGEWELDEQFALDLRDARALLREVYRVLSKHPWAEEECERIRQHLEGE